MVALRRFHFPNVHSIDILYGANNNFKEVTLHPHGQMMWREISSKRDHPYLKNKFTMSAPWNGRVVLPGIGSMEHYNFVQFWKILINKGEERCPDLLRYKLAISDFSVFLEKQ
jgi:hypothetical protein